MKVSLNWIREYLDFDLPPANELATKIGAQLGEVKEVTDLNEKYRSVVVAKVIECRKHEDSDHLNVCLIDDGAITPDVKRGENGLVQVVCGAPNVRAGLTVAWLPPGATVPSSFEAEPFVLSAREIRGVVSNGMLASAKELAIGDSHEGILEIDQDVTPGTSFAQTFGLNDTIIDIENKMFTHRPDCFGELGVAREVAGILGHQFASPVWYLGPQPMPKGETSLDLQVTNEVPELVPRFMAITLAGVAIKPSPVWLQTHLSRVGIRPINNVVDVTNYMMMLTGQPLHAYDYDKVAALSSGGQAKLVVRNPHADETLEVLSGKTITPRSEAIMIATDQQAIGLGGVMGGANSEVDASTQNIILECANFDMYSIRKTSMASGLFSDAVTRFNKGQSPLQNDRILAEAVRLLQATAGAVVAGDVVDDIHLSQAMLERGSVHPAIDLTAQFINERLGLTLSAIEMSALLHDVEFSVSVDDDALHVAAPFFRTDIETREDVVEEVGRLYGFDKLSLALPTRDITPALVDPELDFKRAIRAALAKFGANEVLTYSFVHGNLIDKVGQDTAQAFKLSNALSPDLQYFRLSLTPSLLDKVHANIKAGYQEFALFELGKAHKKGALNASDHDLPNEEQLLSLVLAAEPKAAHKSAGAAYYHAQLYLMELLAAISVPATDLRFEPLKTEDAATYQVAAPFAAGRSASIYLKDELIGFIGEYKAEVRKALKLPAYAAGFELNFAALMGERSGSTYQPLSRFPKVQQDITLKVPATTPYATLHGFIATHLHESQQAGIRTSLLPLDIYQKGDDAAHKQITWRITFVSDERTLTDSEVTKVLDELAAAMHESHGAERI